MTQALEHLSKLAGATAGRRNVNIGRHRRNCRVCMHRDRAEIESEFVSWTSPKTIARVYGLPDRSSIYRHAHATGLFAKRQKNVRAALEKIIERAGDVEVTSAAVVAAIQVYARINSRGQLVERREQINVNELFDRMSEAELESYAKDGSLPKWFGASISATAPHSEEAENEA